jgi:hypothetical protein
MLLLACSLAICKILPLKAKGRIMAANRMSKNKNKNHFKNFFMLAVNYNVAKI